MTYPWLQAVEAEFVERRRSGRIAHALLLSGPAHVGKVELARKFMASLMCSEESYPGCGTCRSCQLWDTGAHPDGQEWTFEVNDKTGKLRSVLIIDQVRRLISSLQLTCTFSPRKTALIFPAEAMNISTANALLKTLEEPPGDSVIILVTSNPARLPATIRSRCQNLHVRTPELALGVEWLMQEEGLSAADAALALTAAAGSPLRAQQMVHEESVEQYRLVSAALDALLSGKSDPGRVAAELAEVDPETLWAWFSLRAAREVQDRVGSNTAAKQVSLLQTEADRNRYLMKTPVRKDFLLRDWLIQWARLAA